jgi:hypothetical protein
MPELINALGSKARASTMRGNLRSGLEWGAAFAAVYSGYAVLLWLVRGAAPFRGAETTLPKVLAAYFAAGLVGGGLFGLCLPLGRTRPGAALLGLLIGVPVMYAMVLAATPPSEWMGDGLVAGLIGGGCLGPVAGVAMWYVNRRFERIRDRR